MNPETISAYKWDAECSQAGHVQLASPKLVRNTAVVPLMKITKFLVLQILYSLGTIYHYLRHVKAIHCAMTSNFHTLKQSRNENNGNQLNQILIEGNNFGRVKKELLGA